MKAKRSRARTRAAVRDPRRVERAHPAVRAPGAEPARVRRSAVHLAARAAPPVQRVLRRQLDRHAAVRAGFWRHRRLFLWCRCRGGTRYGGRVAQRTALRNPRVIFFAEASRDDARVGDAEGRLGRGHGRGTATTRTASTAATSTRRRRSHTTWTSTTSGASPSPGL